VSWTVLFTRQAQQDARMLASASPALQQKAQALLDLLAVDPCQQPSHDEALVGELYPWREKPGLAHLKQRPEASMIPSPWRWITSLAVRCPDWAGYVPGCVIAR
jgi:hypothetical protein